MVQENHMGDGTSPDGSFEQLQGSVHVELLAG